MMVQLYLEKMYMFFNKYMKITPKCHSWKFQLEMDLPSSSRTEWWLWLCGRLNVQTEWRSKIDLLLFYLYFFNLNLENYIYL